MRTPDRVTSIRPLVRYVDQERAIVHACFAVTRASDDEAAFIATVQGAEGFYDEARTALPPGASHGEVRFEIVHPERWWPAGMGEQPLYELTVQPRASEAPEHAQSTVFGLTSVRAPRRFDTTDAPTLLINGEEFVAESVVTVDRVDENQLLPATGGSLLLVTDHYGPDTLYEAADRAGILLLQCVPLHPQAEPERDVPRQIDRLAGHPSLAGYFVGHLGRLSDNLAHRLRNLDPTRTVFQRFPGTPAA